jgi:phosphoglycolate phosphatase
MVDLKIREVDLNDIELMIFDKDGTLFELYPYWSVLARKRAELICDFLRVQNHSLIESLMYAMGIDVQHRRLLPKGPIGVYPRPYIQNRVKESLEGKGYSVDDEAITNAFVEADKYITDDSILPNALTPVRGILTFLKSVKGQCKCAIYSYDLTAKLRKIAGLFSVEDNFDMFLGGDLVDRPKPDPWGAEKILTSLAVSPDQTAFVGDSLLDMQCGQSAHCKYLIAVKSDISDISALRQVATCIIDDFSEVEVL